MTRSLIDTHGPAAARAGVAEDSRGAAEPGPWTRRRSDDSHRQGPELHDSGVRFRTWAPAAREVVLVLEGGRDVPMRTDGNGFHVADVPGLTAGARYRYRIDGRGPFPDPASRFQPEGVHGASQVVAPDAYRWRDAGWKGVRIEGQVLYELHVGTFTREGTFDAARDRLAYLAELGVTLIEVMPIAQFPGRFNWGYDGVSLFAPHCGYGDYDAFKRFVDDAHAHGLGVILDVVYNHFGPDGAYHREFSPYWFTDRHDNEWGDAINYDGPHCEPVRQFVIDNACYWIREFHLDGLRLDATQSIHDAGEPHVLAELSRRSRAAAGERSIVLFAENEPQDVRCIAATERGGFGLDAMWNDDFHHAARVALTGRREGYLHDYDGSPQEFVSAIRRGFLFQGQPYRWQKAPRGTRVTDEPASAFVHFIQNHDQVANSLQGDRCSVAANPALVRALTALTLLGPQTPMLFMGQEYGARQPFPFFADHHAELAPLVFEGRRGFLGQFPSYGSDAAQRAVPDPADPRTFESARLDVGDEAARTPLYRMHRDLLRLRHDEPALAAQSRQAIDGAVLNDAAFALRWPGPGRELLLVVNLGAECPEIAGAEPLLACGSDERWDVLWSSEHPDYGGSGVRSPFSEAAWRLPATSATLLCVAAASPGR
jgi:maltooligosyltrehalose trehalohydrolase